MTTLSNGTLELEPTLRTGWSSGNEARNVFHQFLSGELGATLLADAPRSGTLPLLFSSPAAAEEARAALASPGVWTLTDDVSAVSMTFVRAGTLGAIEQAAPAWWLLEVGYQELPS